MKYSTRLSDAVHVLVFISLNEGTGLTSDKIAESIRTNPAVVRKFMSELKRAGLISNTRGHPEPALARDASDITILDVYRAVEGDKPLLHLDTHTNPECGVGVNIQLALKDFYDGIQRGTEAQMASITLADVIARYNERCAGSERAFRSQDQWDARGGARQEEKVGAGGRRPPAGGEKRDRLKR